MNPPDPIFLWLRNATFEALKTQLLQPEGVRLVVEVVDDGDISANFKRLTVRVVEKSGP